MYVNKNLVNIFGIYLVCLGMSWYVLVCLGMSWYVLVCLGMSWYVFGVLDMGEVSATYRTAT